MKPNNEELITKMKNLFCLFFTEKYRDLIDSRLNNLEDIIFYKSDQTGTVPGDKKEDYIAFYDLEPYRDLILKGEIPFSKYILDHKEQGTMMFIKNNALREVIYFPRTMKKQCHYDCVLIHEFLHVLTSHLLEEDGTLAICDGFEKMTLNDADENGRSFEFLDELLHQKLAEEIANVARDNGIFFFNTLEECRMSEEAYKKDSDEVIDEFY